MSVSSLMIAKFHQNLSALKVHCFCDCKERRHYLIDIPRQQERYEVIYGTRRNAEDITSILLS